MTDIDDLRASLSAHADALTDGLTDQTHVSRRAALESRIRRARTQRRAAIAGGVAVVAAGGVVAGLGLPSRHSATPEIAGHSLERTVSFNGFDYTLGQTAQSTAGATQLTLKLPRSPRDRTVELVATGLGSGDATLLQDGNGPYRPNRRTGITTYDDGSVLDRIATASAIDAPIEIASGATTLRVELRNAPATAQVGLAVYDQSKTVPAGSVSADGMAYPRVIGDERLVNAVIGKVGQDSVSITFQGPIRNPDLESLCTTATKKIWGRVTVSGTKGWSGGGCEHDAAAALGNLGIGHGEGVPAHGYGPGQHTITIEAARQAPGSKRVVPTEVADVRLAVGLYDDASPVRTVDGNSIDQQMVFDGRLWQLEQVLPYREGRTTVDASRGPAMLGLTASGVTRYCLSAAGSNKDTFDYDCDLGSGGPSDEWGQMLMPGATYTLSTSDPNAPTKTGSGIGHVLVYRPVG